MIDFETIPQQVANGIIRLMKERKIHNGDRLYEQQLMKIFNVSQTVVREALFILETKDFVERNPRRGVYLNLPTSQDIEKLFETREVIEVFTNIKAVKVLTEEQIEEIEKIMIKAENNLYKRDFAKYYYYGGAFHSKIYLFTGYIKLKKLYENIQDLFDIYYVNKTDEISEYEENMLELNDHREILNAIKNRDELKCEKITKSHILHVRQRLENHSKIKEKLNETS